MKYGTFLCKGCHDKRNLKRRVNEKIASKSEVGVWELTTTKHTPNNVLGCACKFLKGECAPEFDICNKD